MLQHVIITVLHVTEKFLGGPSRAALSFLVFFPTAFSVFAVSDISRFSQGPNYLSIWPACHQLLQLPSNLAEFPRMPLSILNSFPLVSGEKESFSFCELLNYFLSTPSRN